MTFTTNQQIVIWRTWFQQFGQTDSVKVSYFAGRFFTVGATKEACADVECYVNTFQKYMQELIKPCSISTQVVSWQLSPSGK